VTDDRLRRTMAEVLDVPSELLTETSSPDSVASWDSLNHLLVVSALESEFGVTLSVDDALQMRSVSAARAILRERGAGV
jgi:acyl carrier protein